MLMLPVLQGDSRVLDLDQDWKSSEVWDSPRLVVGEKSNICRIPANPSGNLFRRGFLGGCEVPKI